jgi:hypothetical protein
VLVRKVCAALRFLCSEHDDPMLECPATQCYASPNARAQLQPQPPLRSCLSPARPAAQQLHAGRDREVVAASGAAAATSLDQEAGASAPGASNASRRPAEEAAAVPTGLAAPAAARSRRPAAAPAAAGRLVFPTGNVVGIQSLGEEPAPKVRPGRVANGWLPSARTPRDGQTPSSPGQRHSS